MPSKKSSKHAASRKSAAKRSTAASKKKSAPKRPAATKAAKKAASKKISAKKIVAKKGPAKKKPVVAAVARKSAHAAKKPAKAPAKKPAVRAKAPKAAAPKKRTAPAAASAPVRRRENGGHIEEKYGKELLARGGVREEEQQAFLGGPRTTDDLAEGLGEEFVEQATSGEDEGEDRANQVVTEERGGPFVITTAGTEFADGVDESNPKGAKREPFPTT